MHRLLASDTKLMTVDARPDVLCCAVLYVAVLLSCAAVLAARALKLTALFLVNTLAVLGPLSTKGTCGVCACVQASVAAYQQHVTTGAQCQVMPCAQAVPGSLLQLANSGNAVLERVCMHGAQLHDISIY